MLCEVRGNYQTATTNIALLSREWHHLVRNEFLVPFFLVCFPTGFPFNSYTIFSQHRRCYEIYCLFPPQTSPRMRSVPVPFDMYNSTNMPFARFTAGWSMVILLFLCPTRPLHGSDEDWAMPRFLSPLALQRRVREVRGIHLRWLPGEPQQLS